MRLIFLDFDGVVVPFSSEGEKMRPAKPDPICVGSLNELTSSFLDSHLVVCSSWRNGQTIDRLIGLMRSWGIRGSVQGATPSLGAPRWVEVLSYWTTLVSHGADVSSLVVLDDDRLDAGLLDERWVSPDPQEGFKDWNLMEASEILRKPLRIH